MNAIPSVPTDNLYKFCAVAGGIAVILSALISFQAWRDILRQQWLVQQRAGDLRGNALDVEIAETALDPAWIPDGGHMPEGKLRETIEKKISRLKGKYAAAEKNLGDAGQALASRWHDFGILCIVTGVGASLGMTLVIYGFRKWQVIQRKQDHLLDLEITKRSRDLESAT